MRRRRGRGGCKLTSMQGEEDMFNEGQDSVVLDVPGLTEGLLQLLLHVLLPVQQVNLRLLQKQEIVCKW